MRARDSTAPGGYYDSAKRAELRYTPFLASVEGSGDYELFILDYMFKDLSPSQQTHTFNCLSLGVTRQGIIVSYNNDKLEQRFKAYYES